MILKLCNFNYPTGVALWPGNVVVEHRPENGGLFPVMSNKGIKI